MITEQDRLIARVYGPPPRPMPFWFRVLFAGIAVITLVNLVAPGDRESRVTLLLFLVVFTILTGVGFVIAPQRGRIQSRATDSLSGFDIGLETRRSRAIGSVALLSVGCAAWARVVMPSSSSSEMRIAVSRKSPSTTTPMTMSLLW